jgi:DegV family protein with EDD domain
MNNSSLCILTDDTCQLPHGGFSGQRLIKSLPLRSDTRSVSAPSVDDFLRAYSELECEYSAILVLTLSNCLLPVAEIAQQASVQHGGMAHITVLDSKQTGTGLGMLAQIGAQAAAAGEPLVEVEQRVRSAIPYTYTLIHAEMQNLSRHEYFSSAGQADGEALGLFPLFVLEDGQLVPYKKVRTRRHLLESFQEFVEEFETPQQIAFLRGKSSTLRSRPLREITKELFPKTPFSEADMSSALATLFGAQAVGITVMEIPV